MKINSFRDTTWPLEINCNCGCNFSPETAKDLSRLPRTLPGLAEHVTCMCPVCGTKYLVDENLIPEPIRSDIPWDMAFYSATIKD